MIIMNLIEQVASDPVVDQAFTWLCHSRRKQHHNRDVWWLRFHWARERPRIQQALLAGTYRFDAVQIYRTSEGAFESWSARDALVLKALAIVLGGHLRLSERCYHLAGNGGAKRAVCDVVEALPKHTFVFCTDVKSYYASIDHDVLQAELGKHIDDGRVLRLLADYMQRVLYDGGVYREPGRGISLGCPLSPLMAALYLKPIDDAMDELDLFYARFMDDWVILAPTRWKLRRAVKRVNEILNELNVKQHPDKTFVGRISRGFDFLGYDFSPTGITGMSRRTVEKFAKRVAQLYEQGADAVGIGQYVRRWLRWTTAGLDGRVRWKETGYPVGCESVIGRFLPDLLSLRDTGGLWSRPSINHLTPTLISLSGERNGAELWR